MKKLFNDGLVIYFRLLNLLKYWYEEYLGKRNDFMKYIENKCMLFDNLDVYFFFILLFDV